MKKTQIIWMVFALFISIMIFSLLNHVPPVKAHNHKPNNEAEHEELKETILETAMSSLSKENQLKCDSLIKDNDYKSLAMVFEKSNQFDAAMYAYIQLSKSLETERDLLFVGKKLVNSLKFIESPVIKEQGARVAKSIYDDLVKEDTTNSAYQVGLAGCYIEGLNDIMTGVTILKKILETEPNHVHANFQLGRLGIVSGQFDKAISRLKVVVRQDPKDIDALLYLADAHIGLKQNDNAVNYLKQASDLIENPELKFKIGKYIEELIN